MIYKNMKRKVTISILCIMIFSIACGAVFLFLNRPVSVDNTTPVEQIITKDYGLKKLLLAEATFYVRDGFEKVTVQDLAREIGLKLECKRQTSDRQFYYVVCGDGYRCFLFTDEFDIIHNVLVVHDFVTIKRTRECVSLYENLPDPILLTESAEHSFCELWRTCGHSTGYWHRLFILQDGVLVLKEPYAQSVGAPAYFYYTDEEWESACGEWDGFTILPIDKQPWH